MKKPVTALALAAAAVATLAVPAEAATTRPKPVVGWQHWSAPCATGGKSATLATKYVNGRPIKTWYDNRCTGQMIWFIHCQPDSQSDCTQYAVKPHSKGWWHGGWPGDPMVPPSLGPATTCSGQWPVAVGNKWLPPCP